ncbi:anhydro-N-acetylmuramic acid kinase [Chryseobacterium sp. Leaf180]|uniref:anhydro-N-acetylmuramic acid kinase n=1 Tax=Chryseobacterium sp. Leaf180 TaxID=1736289 RepID=UPI0006FF519E|nr:anhydro-N-acetylmuramic acid kinase [Chryseobacterium sp. Leaf180]KQR93439.1 anhydro-N-acetylmuramic acid kinase [Chryseobacterium sp. Leaf180]
MKDFHAIGLMSGTSLDGLDICYAKFQNKNGHWSFKILKAETVAYNSDLKNQLKNSIHLSSEKLLALHSEYGFYLGDETKKFIEKNRLEHIDLIASHGHTVFHQPQNKFTLQIGDGRAIKLKTGLPVIYDFRSQDVLMGGNGAPLVPIGDELLFSEYDACVNLGGFSNISFKKDQKRIAFDISPLNIVLNKLAQKLGREYDENGDVAKSGIVKKDLLEKLNSLDFYRLAAPKSLGIEWCSQHIFTLTEVEENTENCIATFTEHAAIQLAKVLNENGLKKVLITGGGAYNSFFVELLKEKTGSEIIIPERQIIEFKEALIFAFMGVLRSLNEINVLSSSTGSSRDHSSGSIA